ncbi:MAG: hypothetical protein IPM29_16695 [Planctomycetes bacterium]|nr:hypothetical protein [Planctomycetota bacterium]
MFCLPVGPGLVSDMTVSLRIAVVDRESSGLAARLRQVPGPLQIERFQDVIEDAPKIQAHRPDVLFVVLPVDVEPEFVGGLRVLVRMLEDPRTVLIAPQQREVLADQLAVQLGARVLTSPVDRADLIDALALSEPPEVQPGPASFLALARGISDEINNPLLFAAGHLQLLESMCDPARDIDKLDQLAAVRRGLDRIGATMAKIRLMSRARSLQPPLPTAPAGELVGRAITELPRGARELLGGRLPFAVPDVRLPCDAPLLIAALGHLLEVAAELGRIAQDVTMQAISTRDTLRLSVTLSGLDCEDWQLPRAFEPYYLRSALRGTAHGLNLFLVQTVVHAHGGRALARRDAERSITFELVLPLDGSAA